MSNILYLGSQDFYVGQGSKGPVICCTINGVVFVMFHADPQKCQNCDVAKPEFQQLPHIISGAKFAYCNMSRCEDLAEMSFKTITPLNRVPLFILFVNGRPFMNYTGQRQLKHFAEFMQLALQRLQQQTVFGSNGQAEILSPEQAEKENGNLPYDYDYVTVTNPTMIGQVTCEEGVCYLMPAKEGYGGTEDASKRQAMNPMQQPVALGQQQQQRSPAMPQQMQGPPPQQQYRAVAPPQQQYMNRMPQQQPQQPYYPPQQQQFQQPYYAPVQQPYYPPPQAATSRPMMTQAQQQMYPAAQQQPYYPPQQQYYQQR